MLISSSHKAIKWLYKKKKHGDWPVIYSVWWKGYIKKAWRFLHRMWVVLVLVYKLCPFDQKHCLIIWLFLKVKVFSVFIRTMITVCTPSYPYWIVSGGVKPSLQRRHSDEGGVITNFFWIGNVFEYLSSCPTHTPLLLFFRTLFNLKFVVVGFVTKNSR